MKKFNLSSVGKSLLLLFSVLALVLGGLLPAAAVTIDASPNKINIGLRYHGAKVTVTGRCNPGEDLIIKVTSPPEESHLKFKGKAAGLFWMKKGNMIFSPVSELYKVYTTKALNQIMTDTELQANRLGYDVLADQAEIKSDKMEVDKSFWFSEFIKFKEKDQLYSIQEGVITRHHSPEEYNYQLEIDWPYQASPGNYTIKVIAVKDGHVVDKNESTLTVQRSGIVKKLSNMALNNAALYGLMAIVIAGLAGFGVGSVFKGGGSH